MMNRIQDGDNLTLVAPTAVSAGDIVEVGAIVGVAYGDAESGASFDLATRGVFDLPKETASDVINAGTVVYAIAGEVTADADEDSDGIPQNARLGVAVATSGNGTANVRVRLNGSF